MGPEGDARLSGTALLAEHAGRGAVEGTAAREAADRDGLSRVEAHCSAASHPSATCTAVAQLTTAPEMPVTNPCAVEPQLTYAACLVEIDDAVVADVAVGTLEGVVVAEAAVVVEKLVVEAVLDGLVAGATQAKSVRSRSRNPSVCAKPPCAGRRSVTGAKATSAGRRASAALLVRYQAWVSPQCGQPTEVETAAWNTKPQLQV